MRNAKRAFLVAIAFASVFILVSRWSAENGGDRVQSLVSPMLAKPADAGTLSWRSHDRFAYSVKVDMRITSTPNEEAPEVMKSKLHAVLCARVLETSDGMARVAMQLRSVLRELDDVPDAQRQAALGVAFVVQFEGGMPSTIEFPLGLDREVQSEISGLVRTFQVTVPDSPSAKWSALEEDEAGRYRANYKVEPGGAWNKRKVAYLRGIPDAEKGEEPIRVLDSSATLWPATGGSWWERAEVTEDLQFPLAGALLLQVRHHSVLEALADGFDPTSDIARIKNAADLLRLPVPAYAHQDQVMPRPASPQDWGRFLNLLDSFTAEAGKNFADVHRLAKMLEEFPELAAELPTRLMDAELGDFVAAGLTHALELAGNESCQDALREVFSGSDFPHANRVRAIVGLGGVENPTPASIEALWQAGEYRGTSEMGDLSNTALLALGNLGNNLREAGSERYADLSLGLQRGLATAAPESKAVLLTAMSNTRDPALLPVAALELGASEPAVRVAAIRAVSSVDGREGLDSLSTRLEHEEDSWVRAALVDGMRQLSHTSDSAFVACVNMLRSEKDMQVRAALARYLGDNLEDYPAGRETLEQLLRDRSNSAELRAYVAKALRSSSTPRSVTRR